MTAVLAAAREVRDAGTFGYVESLIRSDELAGYLKQQAAARGGSAG